MFGKFFRKFVELAFISVIKDGESCDVCVKVVKNKNELRSESKRFSMEAKESAKLLYEFIAHQYEKYKIVYTSTIINSINQGGVPGCDKESFRKYEIDTSNATVVCIDNKWSIFASNYDIENTKKAYEDIGGLDSIFSSIVVLKYFFQKDLTSSPTLCILKQKTSATIAILTADELLFSSYAILQSEGEKEKTKSKQDEVIFGAEEGLDEEQLVDLDDIALELQDETESEIVPMNEDGGTDVDTTTSIESLGSDLRVLEFVKIALTQYYKSDMYDPLFIEKIMIADPYMESADIRNLLENELMLTVEHKKIELCDIVASLAIEEVLF